MATACLSHGACLHCLEAGAELKYGIDYQTGCHCKNIETRWKRQCSEEILSMHRDSGGLGRKLNAPRNRNEYMPENPRPVVN